MSFFEHTRVIVIKCMHVMLLKVEQGWPLKNWFSEFYGAKEIKEIKRLS